MKAYINKHQLDQIVAYIQKNYLTFATQKIDGKVTFGKLKNNGAIQIRTEKTIIPFKKILWKDKQEIPFCDKDRYAFIGLTNCDAKALLLFLKEFAHTNLLPDRKNILIISTECKPDQNCFCTAFPDSSINNFDLHIQMETTGFSIFAGTKNGKTILKEQRVKISKVPQIKPINIEAKKLDLQEICTAIDNKPNFNDFWQGIANNCFGCGSCSTVCPICFCVKQDCKNNLDNQGKTCLDWDSCFAKSFSEIQNHFDLRPTNKDRLYNWYHHKFVRSVKKSGYPLCTGCGRCISACPAHLNQHKIVQSIEIKEENYEHKR